MTPRRKKGKKKLKFGNNEKQSNSNCLNLMKETFTYFTNKEIADVKSVLKIQKDSIGVPFIIGATILYKFELLKQLLNNGYSINQTGQNNMTALMWAIKYKHLDIIEYLLDNGADPNIKNDNGDNALLIAVEHKLWDEQATINFYKTIQHLIDINSTNKNGNSLLHLAIKRDWEIFINVLIADKVKIDSTNINGITPLMVACLRNHLAIINILINAGANILKEDNHGRMALCYAISIALKNSNKTPFLVVERIVNEMEKFCTFEEYLKRRLQIIFSSVEKSRTITETIVSIIQFAVHYTINGLSILLEFKIFEQMQQAIVNSLDSTEDDVKFFLTISKELLFSYNEKIIAFNSVIQKQMVDSLFNSGLANICTELLKRDNTNLAMAAFNVIVLAYTSNENWKNWLKENLTIFLPFIKTYNYSQQEIQDESRIKIIKNKFKKIKKLLYVIKSTESSKLTSSDINNKINGGEKKKTDNGFSYAKRTKRRSKAIKAKITKIKSAELTKRLNLNGKKFAASHSKLEQEKKRIIDEKFKLENPLVSSFAYLLELNFDNDDDEPNYPEWQLDILNLPFNCNKGVISKIVDSKKIGETLEFMRSGSNSKISNKNKGSFAMTIDYLREILNIIISKYKEHWENDKILTYCNCHKVEEHVPWYYKEHLKNIASDEFNSLNELKMNFDKLILSIEDLFNKNMIECYENLLKLETVLLNFEVRGTKLFPQFASLENVNIEYSIRNNPFFNKENVAIYMKNVLNNLRNPIEGIKINVVEKKEQVKEINYKSANDLYLKEMSYVSAALAHDNKDQDLKAKVNTLRNSYHLIDSIMNMCEKDDDQNTGMTDCCRYWTYNNLFS